MIGNIADSNVAKSVRRHLTWSQNWFSKLEPSLTSLKFPAVLVLFLAFVMQEEKVTIAFAPVVHSFISFFLDCFRVGSKSTYCYVHISNNGRRS